MRDFEGIHRIRRWRLGIGGFGVSLEICLIYVTFLNISSDTPNPQLSYPLAAVSVYPWHTVTEGATPNPLPTGVVGADSVYPFGLDVDWGTPNLRLSGMVAADSVYHSWSDLDMVYRPKSIDFAAEFGGLQEIHRICRYWVW